MAQLSSCFDSIQQDNGWEGNTFESRTDFDCEFGNHVDCDCRMIHRYGSVEEN